MTRLTQAAIEAIVASVEQGSSIRQAAKANHFTDDQVDDWLRISRGEEAQRNGGQYSSQYKSTVTDLTERCQRAIASRYTVLTHSLYHNATTPNAKTGWYDTQAADKLLSKSPDTRQDWHEQRGAQVQVYEVHPAHKFVHSLSDAEVFDLLPEEYRELVDPPALAKPSPDTSENV